MNKQFVQFISATMLSLGLSMTTYAQTAPSDQQIKALIQAMGMHEGIENQIKAFEQNIEASAAIINKQVAESFYADLPPEAQVILDEEALWLMKQMPVSTDFLIKAYTELLQSQNLSMAEIDELLNIYQRPVMQKFVQTHNHIMGAWATRIMQEVDSNMSKMLAEYAKRIKMRIGALAESKQPAP
ncbi:MAG: hypothetical protein WA154_01420 [Moraxellaceae bacterium]